MISKSGGWMESWVVGRAALKAAFGVRAPDAEARGVMGDCMPASREAALLEGFRGLAVVAILSNGFFSWAEAFGVAWSAGPEGQSLIAAIGLRTEERYELDGCGLWPGAANGASVGVVAGDDDETRNDEDI